MAANNTSTSTAAWLGIILCTCAFITLYAMYQRSVLSKRSLGLQSQTGSTLVSAFVGEFRFTIFGYTSPYARVTLEGQGLFDQTYADVDGKFTFLNRFSPLSPREACLRAHDTDGRSSFPVCLPPFSVKKDVNLGPILLPPSLSVNQDIYYVRDYGILSGKAAPNSLVTVKLFSDTQAHNISVAARTDASGSYSLTLPTEQPKTMRVHSINAYRDLISDKSHTLTMNVMPIWMVIVRYFLAFLDWVSKHILPFVLLAEGILLIALVLMGLRRKSYPPAIRNSLLAKRPSSTISRR